MDLSRSIDIIIPSFRLQKEYLLPLILLPKPKEWIFRYFLVVDNPGGAISDDVKALVDGHTVTLLVNDKNLGASASRNRGIEAGEGQWILFLDDDIQADNDLLFKYTGAIDLYPDETGFIGLVVLPPPPSVFAKALLVNGSVSIFGIAAEVESFSWGATANILVSRSAIADVRFSHAYPKSGGGEDVDFFLKVRRLNQSKDYKTLKEAKVYHPWWGNGKPDFKRPFRHGVGNSYLGELNPQYAYYDFPNTSETVFLLMAMMLPSLLVWPYLGRYFMVSLIVMTVVEWLSITIQLLKRKEQASILVIWYILLLRLSYQAGVLWGNVSRGRLSGIGERFEYRGQSRSKGFFQFNTYKATKWMLYAAFVCWLLSQ